MMDEKEIRDVVLKIRAELDSENSGTDYWKKYLTKYSENGKISESGMMVAVAESIKDYSDEILIRVLTRLL